MIRYLNTTTLKQTTEYLDSTTVIDTDPRVANWFKSKPVGENGEDYKGEWIGDTYSFTMIPLTTQAELDDIELATTQAEFRAERDVLLAEADIEINKLVDAGLATTVYSEYRQQLRDSTITWVLPTKP